MRLERRPASSRPRDRARRRRAQAVAHARGGSELLRARCRRRRRVRAAAGAAAARRHGPRRQRLQDRARSPRRSSARSSRRPPPRPSRRATSASPEEPDMTASVHIGDALSRVDGLVKVTGAARYAAEHPARACSTAGSFRARIAKGRITRHRRRRGTRGARRRRGDHAREPAARRLARHELRRRGRPCRGSPFRGRSTTTSIYFSGQPVALVVGRNAGSGARMPRRWSRSSTSPRTTIPICAGALAETASCRSEKRFGFRCRRTAAMRRRPSTARRSVNQRRVPPAHRTITTRWRCTRPRWSGKATAGSRSTTRRRARRTSRDYLAASSACARTTCACSTRLSAAPSAQACVHNIRCTWRPLPPRCSSARCASR